MSDTTEMFPVLDDIRKIRKIREVVKSGRIETLVTSITKASQSVKTAAEDVASASAEVADFMTFVNGMFGTAAPLTMGSVGGGLKGDIMSFFAGKGMKTSHEYSVHAEPVSSFRDHRNEALMDAVKRKAEALYRSDGLNSIRDDLKKMGLNPSLGFIGDSNWKINDVWEATQTAAAAHGIDITAEVRSGFAKVEGFDAAFSRLGAGETIFQRIRDALERAWQWIVSHEDQLLAGAKILLTILVFLGIL